MGINYIDGGITTGDLVLDESGRPGDAEVWTNAPGEHAVVRGSPILDGNHIVLRENTTGSLVFEDINQDRDLNAGEKRESGLEVNGEDCLVVNVRFYNLGSNTLAHAAERAELIGCHFINTGWDQPGDRGHGHGIYPQNESGKGRKRIAGCIIGNNYGSGFHLFGGSTLKVDDVDLEDSILFQGSSPSDQVPINAPVRITAEPGRIDGVAIRRCFIHQGFEYPSDGGYANTSIALGSGNEDQGDLELTDNVTAGSLVFNDRFDFLRVRGNRFHAIANKNVQGAAWASLAVELYADANPGVTKNNAFKAVYVDNYYDEYAEGTNVGMPGSVPNDVRAYPLPELGRGHVAIFNWQDNNTVPVDVSKICAVGERYFIWDAEAPGDVPLQVFTYDGQPVYFDMARKEARGPVSPLGGAIRATRKTGRRMGAFLIRRS